MLTVRRIDYYGQVLLGTLMIISTPILLFYGFLAGLFILGWWQLFSALLNTSTFWNAGYSKQIINYWLWTAIDLGALFVTIPLSRFFNPDDVQVIGGIAIVCSTFIAIYYLRIYRRLTDKLYLRKELKGLIK
jgi:hypothetical protein